MTQENKELFLKDLFARIPYGVKICYTEPEYKIKSVWNVDYIYPDGNIVCKAPYAVYNIENCLLYLRPMSSMTEEEISDLQKINCQFSFNRFDNLAYVGAADDGFCSVEDMNNILDYLNSHHFDYRHLIDKGLAIEAPEGMYD